MSRLTTRDLATITVLVGLAGLVALLTSLGYSEWAIVVLAGLIALLGVISRLEFATRRRDIRSQLQDLRETRRTVERVRSSGVNLRSKVDEIRGAQVSLRSSETASAERLSQDLVALRSEVRALYDTQQQLENDAIGQFSQDVAALRSEIRGLRVSQQLLSQTVTSTKGEVLSASGDIGVVRKAQDFLANAITTTRDAVDSSKEDILSSLTPLADIGSGLVRIDRQTRYLQAELVNDAQALVQLLTRYTPTTPLPVLSGWALSPAGLVYVLDRIDRQDAQCVVECGSGSSTLWMALAMKAKGSGVVIALENNEVYAGKTRALLEAHGVSEWAQVALCPLTTVQTPRGEFQWYDLAQAPISQQIDLLFVDGPPGTTGRLARYPAVPLLRQRLSERGIVIVDDADRADERETIEFWLAEGLLGERLVSPGRGIEVLEVGQQD